MLGNLISDLYNTQHNNQVKLTNTELNWFDKLEPSETFPKHILIFKALFGMASTGSSSGFSGEALPNVL